MGRWDQVPITQDKAKDIAKKLHCKLGHLGVKIVLAVLWIRAHIPYAQEIVEHIIKTCDECQFTQWESPPVQPFHPILHVYVGDAWAFDFVGPLVKTSQGNQYLLTTMDLGTDWVIAQQFHKGQVKLLQKCCDILSSCTKKPTTLLTENREEFLSYYIQSLLRQFRIWHSHTTPYHSQTNRRLKCFNDILVQMLAKITTPQQQNWGPLRPSQFINRYVAILPVVWKGGTLTKWMNQQDDST